MPLVPVPINRGAFKSVDAFQLSSSELGAEVRNLLLDDAGANRDRPGVNAFSSIGAFAISGLRFFGDKIFAVTQGDRKLWSVSQSGVVTDVTGLALGGTARPVFDEDDTYLAIAGGAALQRWDGAAATELMPGSPESTTHISYLDGWWIIPLLTDQELRIAGPTDAAREIWNSSNFVSAEAIPDPIQATAKLLRELYAFGPSSLEIFANSGDSSVPFGRSTPPSYLDWGIEAPYSVTKSDNTLFWLARAPEGGRKFVKLQGRTPAVIDSPYAREIARMTTISDCWAASINFENFNLITWTFPTEERCFVYDVARNEWSEWDGFVDGTSDRFRMHSYCYAPAWNRHFVGDPVNGTIYELSFSAKADGNNPIRRLRRTGAYDHGTGGEKRSQYYLLDVKRGIGTPGGTEPRLGIRVNDDGKGWSPYRWVGLGFEGAKQTPIRITGLRGIYRKRQLEFVFTDAADFVLNKLEEWVEGVEG